MRAADKTPFPVIACFAYLSSDDVVILRAYFFSYEYPTSAYVFKTRYVDVFDARRLNREHQTVRQPQNTIAVLGRRHSIDI